MNQNIPQEIILISLDQKNYYALKENNAFEKNVKTCKLRETPVISFPVKICLRIIFPVTKSPIKITIVLTQLLPRVCGRRKYV